MSDYSFRLDFKVRDYECDLQGIVNNSVYQNYLEHTRHEYLLSQQLSFSELAAKGINLVVTRVELDYRWSLRSGDHFWVGLNMGRVGKIRGEFVQDIYRAHDDRLILNGKVQWAAVNERGRPFFPAELAALLPRLSAESREN
jgi:acyl-CoA thioester hydrolase